VSGPARPARPAPGARPARRPSEADGGVALGLLAGLDGLSRHRLLDRLIQGRTSIALVAFALIGIVTLQLGLLKLNSSIGHTLERESLLQRENAALSIANSELAAGNRIESRAVALGMELVPIRSLRFLAAQPWADARRAAAALKTAVQPPGSESQEGTAASSAATASAGPAAGGAEQATATTPVSPSSSEASSTPEGEATRSSGESASPPASAPAASAPQPSAAPSSPPGGTSGSGATEAAPAGGTQAAPTG
jgi:hypothetical protein